MTGTTTSERLSRALELPNGARFYRCALQVKPYAYLSRHHKPTRYGTEAEYNTAIIAACRELGIEVIGVTDHYRVCESWGLIQAARDAGLYVFSGFEAVTKEGVHFLCLVDPDREASLERLIGACGIHDMNAASPEGSLDSSEFLDQAKVWRAICVAAHVAASGGLLKRLSGQPRISAWRSTNLLACALAGPVSDAPENIRSILENKDPEHQRRRPVAVINASDVTSPEDLAKSAASCFIKMSSVSVEALRQAFLDPESRIRLNGDPHPEPHAEILAATWEGGFLSDTSVHFNDNLNVLVGGRGTGKSTMIESLRYALGLEPPGEEARKAHDGFIRDVLGAGTKISILVRSYKPSVRCYTIERSVPNPPIVKDETGQILTLSPKDVMPGVEVFGQHEISELTRKREKLTLLLERFVDRDPAFPDRTSRLKLDLERSRSRIVDVRREMTALDERLAALPGLNETQKRFQEAGLEERLKEKSLLIREERLFADLGERLDPLRELRDALRDTLPFDTAFVSAKALEGLPNAAILSDLGSILETLSTRLMAITGQLTEVLAEADSAVAETKARWDKERKAIEETYERILRELQKSNVDGAEFIRLRKQIEELRPLREKKEALKRNLGSYEAHRRKLLAEWEDARAGEYREFERAAKKVSRILRNRVRVEVTMAGDREPLKQLIREIGGNLTSALSRLESLEAISLSDLAQRCREGKEALVKHYGFTPGCAQRISEADPSLFMRIEELDLPATTKIELNTAPAGEPETWRPLEALSTGQKATAVLLLLLLESDAPLIVDQPEDDLDNRFITEGIVPIIKQEKQRRQFIFSTHNANIPVLGDAELILGLAASGEGTEGHAKIAPEQMGSIDSGPVRELVEEILEGGKDAFETRRSKYGF